MIAADDSFLHHKFVSGHWLTSLSTLRACRIQTEIFRITEPCLDDHVTGSDWPLALLVRAFYTLKKPL